MNLDEYHKRKYEIEMIYNTMIRYSGGPDYQNKAGEYRHRMSIELEKLNQEFASAGKSVE